MSYWPRKWWFWEVAGFVSGCGFGCCVLLGGLVLLVSGWWCLVMAAFVCWVVAIISDSM